MIKRRGALSGGVGRPAWPARRSGAPPKTPPIGPRSTPNSVDPIWTASQVSRNLGFMVFDPRYGGDAAGVPHRLMVKSELMEDGGRRWTMRPDALEGTDDQTIVWQWSGSVLHMRAFLSKVVRSALMMPERVALSGPFRQIAEVIGSASFRWLPGERVLASHVGFARFDGYVAPG
jgi:peptide/nickel transport system substrate-binding protein